MSGMAHAADSSYPQRAVRVIIPFPPAGAGDILGRMITARLTQTFEQQFINDNRPGGGQVIATELAARANPDGHTLFLASATHAMATYVGPNCGMATINPPTILPSKMATKVPISTMPLPPVSSLSLSACGR